MIINTLNSYEEMSQQATEFIFKSIKKKANLLLCASTGFSPTLTYHMLAEKFKNQPSTFSRLRVIKLDEWGGLPVTENGTCETYLQQHLIKPLNISRSRYTGFHSNPEDPEKECKLISNYLTNEGPVDLCILGLGQNGHLALNEPANKLQTDCHIANLTDSSLQHQMISDLPKKPKYGLTLGIGDIMASKTILLLVSGKKKNDIVKRFLTKEISTSLPASLLWLHQNVFCLIDGESIQL